jgi:VIT1/CCC1 family predicted Fe2+/Mn2+ transporter
MTIVNPSTPRVEADEFPHSTLRLGQYLMAGGAIGLATLMACRLALQAGSHNAIQFAVFVASAWLMLLGSAMTELAGVRGRSRTVARALLALASCYLLGRLLLSSMH